MLTFTANADISKLRTETLRGRQYLVVPTVAIKAPAVLNGELITLEELRKGFGSWDGRPVTLGHPQADGDFISANDPTTLAQVQVGNLYRTTIEDGKLKGEMWLDTALAQATADGRELLRRVMNGEPVEVSTGYFRELDAVTGSYAGKSYSGKAKDLKPDHLAILLYEMGACSWGDGCGAPRVNQKTYRAPEAARNNARKALRWREEHGDEVRGGTRVGWTRARQLANNEPLSLDTVCRMAAFARHESNSEVAEEYRSEPWRDNGYVAWLIWGGTSGINWAKRICESERSNNVKTNVLSQARTPSYSGTNSASWSRPALEDYGFDVASIDDLTGAQRTQIAEGSLLGDTNAETYSELSFFPVVSPGGELNENALVAVLGGRGAQADIPASALESARTVARRLLNEEFDRELETDSAQNSSLLSKIWHRLQELTEVVNSGAHVQPAVNQTADADNADGEQEEADMATNEFLELAQARGVELTAEELATVPLGIVDKLEVLLREGGDPVSAPAPAVNTLCAKLENEVEAVGGADAAMQILVNHRQARAAKRQAAVEAVVERTGMAKADAEAMTDGALESLVANLAQPKRQPDYSGRTGKAEVDTEVQPAKKRGLFAEEVE